MAAIRSRLARRLGEIRVVFAGESAIRGLDDLVLGFGVDLQDLVRIGRAQPIDPGRCPMLVQARCRQRLGLVRAQPAEQVADDVAERGRHGQREDRPEQARQRAADDDREHHRGRMQLHRVALDLRDQKVVLDLLDERVQGERGDDRGGARRRREQHRRDRGDDRPDDRDQLQNARDDRQQEGVPPEDRIHQLAQDHQPDEREDSDREPEDRAGRAPIGRRRAQPCG